MRFIEWELLRGNYGFTREESEIRDPIYGFIKLDGWERTTIDSPEFQQLARIRQLGLTSMALEHDEAFSHLSIA